MLTIKANLKIIQPALIKLIAGSLKIGAVAVLPTDTIYGLSCRADDAKAVRRIKRLKKSEAKKPLIILVSDFKMLKKYVAVDPRQEKFLRQIWGQADSSRRPTTVILKSKNNLLKEAIAADRSLAIRLPKSEFLTKIIRSVGTPLVSTSLNLTGKEPLADLRRLSSYFKGDGPDLALNIGVMKQRRPSRLIDLRDASQPVVLRK